ncbi:DUF2059 domain-containing protein [Rhizobium sp. TRM95111]|uniref:DUF2059 domain-containing protein n=1 Tax=Rhizobium alarense TaxID=2846851 RepID=UPI001F46E163|nr:DUF2059 domain-containing protein [Rhizobium alarense]MCF3642779.1 DUF2059 domain-containing protein [Rhizobium alarense]
MITFAGLGRTLAATLVVTAALAGAARAQDVTDEQIKAARTAMDALAATAPFDNILPNLAARLKGTLIQSNPNHEALINTTVDTEALTLAARRADLEREAATIYAKSFSVEELKAIADFYNSPVGKKLLKDGPIAARETMKAANIWASGISRDLAVESSKKLQAEIGTVAPAVEEGQQPAEATPQQ